MNNWKMLTFVGIDQLGIVAHITSALSEGGLMLGETSMLRLGGNFTMMMMVKSKPDVSIRSLVQASADQFQLTLHIDPIQGELHHHVTANYTIRVYGADSVGIVAKVTHTLATLDFNILELESDVIGTDEEPIYLIVIQGYSARSLETLEIALKKEMAEITDISITAIENFIA